jgi:hypothetical protein
MSGRESSWQPMVSVDNFHRSARAPPATRRHAGHIRINYDSAGHSPTSRLCRLPGIPAPRLTSAVPTWLTSRTAHLTRDTGQLNRSG